MLPRFWWLGIACGVVALLGNPAALAKVRHGEKQTEFGTGVRAGFGVIQYHNTCIHVQAFFISGDFFDGLQVEKTPQGAEFKKRKVTYRNFPDQLVVDVEAFAWKCTERADQITPPDYAAGLMEKASFDLSWKRGDEIRPATLLSAKERHPSPGLRWYYFLTVPSKDVPLTDNLVIDVSLREGIARTQLTTNLKCGLGHC
ncbi:MAG: hypothetical protein HY010_00225 [Acidobacteria bacterium]|nr:hypothetical protein [Acidobacteriota bacterium]